MKFAKYDKNGRCISGGRSFKRIKSALEFLMMAIMGVGTAAIVTQALGLMTGIICP